MKRTLNARGGFTLIELLTVIAIIGILASITLAAVPKVLEKAKIASLVSNFKQLDTALVSYYTEHGTYPPAYGYIGKHKFSEQDLSTIAITDFATAPYLDYLGFFDNRDVYDRFSDGVDTNLDGQIGLMEFSPVGAASSPGSGEYSFINDELYDPSTMSSSMQNDLNRQLAEPTRPILYIPINKRQFKRYSQYLYDQNSTDPRPRDGDFSPLSQGYTVNNVDKSLSFPPNTYDAYVLISLGPERDSGGILAVIGNMESGVHPFHTYHALGMMTYFMATRDAQRDLRGEPGSGELDFDFIARTQRGERKIAANERLPNGFARGGPIIHVSP